MNAHLTSFVQDILQLVVEEEDVGARLSQFLDYFQVAVGGGQVKWCALLQIVVTISSLSAVTAQLSLLASMILNISCT